MRTSHGIRISPKKSQQKVTEGLGWFSIGLGAAQLLAPRGMARLIGVRASPTLMRLLGLRELACGIGILTQRRPSGWLKARVAGDAMDLGLLAAAFDSAEASYARVAMATTAVAAVTALDIVGSQNVNYSLNGKAPAERVVKCVTIARAPEELYAFWHNFERLPSFMNHLVSVRVTGRNRSHWVAKGPAGTVVEWDAEIIADHPNELIAWRTLENADVDHAGSVLFQRAPGGRGTIVKVEMHYRPPAGTLGAKAAKLLGEAPEKQIYVDLLRFKQLMETGEIARTEGQPAGRPKSTSKRFDDLIRA